MLLLLQLCVEPGGPVVFNGGVRAEDAQIYVPIWQIGFERDGAKHEGLHGYGCKAVLDGLANEVADMLPSQLCRKKGGVRL